MNLYFVTGNKGKFEEVKNLVEVYTKLKINLNQMSLNIPELDSFDLVEISQNKALQAFKQIKNPVITDDSGIYFDEYNNFPGPLAKRVFNGLGFKGLERLFMGENIVKTGKFITVISYMDEKLDSPVSFLGEISGTYCFSLIKNFSNEDLQRFAYLPYKYIFKPNGFGKFYSELTRKESIKVSQRAKAVKKFLDWIKKKNNLFFNT